MIFEEALQYASSLGRQLDVGLIENAAILSSQAAYRQRLRGQTQLPSTHNVEVMSRTLGRMEEVRVEVCDGNHAQVITSRGNTYDVTETSCTCPDFRYRLQGTGESCRHMEAHRIARGQAVSPSTQLLRDHLDEEARRQARRSFEFVDWREQEAREGVLEVWRENKAFDGTFISEDNAAWEDLLSKAGNEWEYKYENVLGGTGNSFGIEIEFELPYNIDRVEIANALHEAGILDTARINGYHSTGGRPGFWKLERDGSLQNGLELVSPILFDRRETWEQIEKATRILREKGATVNERTGGHIHIGIGPLDHKTYAWQRLSRIGLGYEKLFYRMGGADSEAYRNGTHGRHRGSRYTIPLNNNRIRRIRGNEDAAEARARLSESRYSLFNATNVDNVNSKPTIEMRYPNSTLDHLQWQAQIQVANSIVHQSAVIKNTSPQSRFTPGLTDRANQLRFEHYCTETTEREHFRKFLDVVGNQEDRLAATWLFLRGRA
ncbi:amidoligase family protein [Paenibacillus anaericanus]|uniref:amidoligase family protein n=1 Tax=Paenibacillus anaericanus TaxID=170367 RepID=UPI0014776369|nr:amidoligase family protein [Paenibacillus anaericanus]